MTEVFQALSDPTRLKILNMVATRSNNFFVAEIAEKLGISSSAVSQHLKVLKNAGIVEPVRDGFHVYYKINDEIIESFRSDIDKLIGMLFFSCTFEGPCSECPNDTVCKQE